MIRPNIKCTLSGIHFLAFGAFCERIKENITKRGILRLIEMLPEYQQLTSLREVADKDTKSEQLVQAEIT